MNIAFSARVFSVILGITSVFPMSGAYAYTVSNSEGSVTIDDVAGYSYPYITSNGTGNMSVSNIALGNVATLDLSCTAGYKSTASVIGESLVPNRLLVRCDTSMPSSIKHYSVAELNINKTPTNTTTCTFPPGVYRISCNFYQSYGGFSPGPGPLFNDQKVVTVSLTNADGACGTQNDKIYTYLATAFSASYNFCSAGSPLSTPVFPNQGSMTTWMCPGFGTGTDTLCSASRGSPSTVNGSCGTANGKVYTSSDTTFGSDTLCTFGSLSPATIAFPAVDGTTSWTCKGIGFWGTKVGTTASCSASRTSTPSVTPVNGVCGTAQTTYSLGQTTYGGRTFCSAGQNLAPSPAFPAPGSSVSWTCSGESGGSDVTCTADRQDTYGICGTVTLPERNFILDPIISRVTGIWGSTLGLGQFLSSGNHGFIDFTIDGTVNTTGATFIGPDLVGWFWIQTIGWVNIGDCYPVQIVEPVGGANVGEGWTLSGYAWSENAGWIEFQNNQAGSQTYYDPTTRSFSGWAWNDGIGWIDFTSGESTFGTDFIGRVKVLGTIGGQNAFATPAYSPGDTVSNMTTEGWVNQIRKNVAVLLRNTTNFVNTIAGEPDTMSDQLKTVQGVLFLAPSSIYDGVTISNATQDYFSKYQVQSIIAVGGDIYIAGDIPQDTTGRPQAIIAIRDQNGKGGNIYIGANVKYIYASLIAEGSLFSGEYRTSGVVVYATGAIDVTALPQNQLLIHGSVISHNTIGGAITAGATSVSRCPFGVLECNRDTAIMYDMNYFRAYTAGTDATRAWNDTTYDDYSMIIEYDPRIISDPPPGMKDE